MSNKMKAFLEIFSIVLLGAGVMIGLKVLSPVYGEYIFWSGFIVVYLYFAYTYKVALLELEDFYKSLNNKNSNND